MTAMSRRALLRLGLLSAPGLLLLGHVTPSTAHALADRQPDEVLDDAIRQLQELGLRIRAGEGRTLPDGTVVIDGWFLPASYVERIQLLTAG